MKKTRPLWIWIAIFAAIILLVLLTKYKVDKVHNSQLNVDATGNSSATLYVPSPYELSMIAASKELWPRRFGPGQPPQVSDLPIIYNLFLQIHPTAREEIDFFRALAVTSSLGEWDAFKDLLTFRLHFKNSGELSPKNILAWVHREKCSLFGQEVAYRLVVWSPDKLKDVEQIFSACPDAGFFAFWFKVLEAQTTKNESSLRELRDQAQAKRERLPTESFEYFLMSQIFAVLDLKLAHEFKAKDN